MNSETSILNLDAIKKSNLNESPFPHIKIDNVITEGMADNVVNDFPNITQGGSFPVKDEHIKGEFGKLITELKGPALAKVLSEKLSMDLTSKPVMLTLRGFSRQKDGRIHTDSKSKLVTILIYLNTVWDENQGNLRVLRNGTDIEDYTDEISPHAGSCFIFKVTDNCWHGYKSFEGTRKSIQLNYIVSEKSAQKHLKLHGFTAKLKSFFK